MKSTMRAALAELQTEMAEALATLNSIRESLTRREKAETPALSGLLTVQEVAQELHVSRAFVSGLLKTGKLQGYRVGQHEWRIKRADLDAFLEECAPKPAPALSVSLKMEPGGGLLEPYDELRPCISLAGAARALGATLDGVRRLASAGTLEVVRFGDEQKVTAASVEAYLWDRLARAMTFESLSVLTISEAATLLGAKPEEVRRLVERGRIKHVRFDSPEGSVLRDSEVRVYRSALMEHLSRQRREAAEAASLESPAELLAFPRTLR